MNGWTESLGTLLLGASLLLSAMGLWFTTVIPGIDRWSRRFFMFFFLIFMLCCLSWVAELALQRYVVPGAAFYLLLLFESLLLSLPLPMIIEIMCGGTMEIAPREGGGTVVRVRIPQQGCPAH